MRKLVERIEENMHSTKTDGVPTRALHPVHQLPDLHPLRPQSLRSEERECRLVPKGEEWVAHGAGQMNAWLAYVW